MAEAGEDEDADWLRELLACGPQRHGNESRDGAWTDDSEVTEFLAELLSARGDIPIPGPALPQPFAVAPPAVGAASPRSPAAGFQKRKADAAGLRQDARGVAARAPATPQASRINSHVPRLQPAPHHEPAPRHEPALRHEPEPCKEPVPCSKRAASGPTVSLAQRLPPAPGRRRRAFDAACLPEAVRQLSSTGRLLEALAADEIMELDVPRRNAMAGAVLEHAVAVIERQLRAGPAVFKIGITMNPSHRWHNEAYGYGRSSDKYAKMVVLLISARGEAAAFLEAALISKLQATIGCRNIASGGEGLRPAEGPFFTYLVIAPPA